MLDDELIEIITSAVWEDQLFSAQWETIQFTICKQISQTKYKMKQEKLTIF